MRSGSLRPILLLSLLTACAADPAQREGPGSCAPSPSAQAESPDDRIVEDPVPADSVSEEPPELPDPPSALPGLWEIREGPGAPFLLSPPADKHRSAPVVLFIPGGAGIRDHALPTFQRWLANGEGRADFWLLVPYADDGNLTDDGPRIGVALQRVLDERASADAVIHLAGTSNGGRTAFRLLFENPGRYASFLGAPALPSPEPTDERLTEALAGKPVLLAVGSEDDGWLQASKAFAQRLDDLGIDCELAELPGEGHILSEAFDETRFFGFWTSRAAGSRR